MKLTTRWHAIRLFYSSVAPALMGLSALIFLLGQLPPLLAGHAASLGRLVMLKLLAAPAVWYLSEQTKPHQYWLYFNMGLSRRALWGTVIGLDTLLFAGVAAGINYLYLAL